MFSPQEMREHLARIECLRQEHELAAVGDGEPDLDDPKASDRRTGKFDFVKELLKAPALGTS